MSNSIGKGFVSVTDGDVNWLAYGAVWGRKIAPRRYHFIELTNMEEARGRDNAGQPTYYLTLCEVDLGEVPERCCGLDDDAPTLSEDAVADAVRSYGVAAPLHEVSTSNAHKGLAECRKESYRLTRDAHAHQQALDRPVNRIGSTAREFGRGDLNAAVLRGLKAGNQDAWIIAKMHVAAGGRTLGGRIPEEELHAMAAGLLGEKEEAS